MIKMKKKITKSTTFAEALAAKPKSAIVMLKYGLHCVGCHMIAEETIEQGAEAHGMNEKEMKKMIEEMNRE